MNISELPPNLKALPPEERKALFEKFVTNATVRITPVQLLVYRAKKLLASLRTGRK